MVRVTKMHSPVQPIAFGEHYTVVSKLGPFNPGSSHCSIANCCSIKHTHRAFRIQAQHLQTETCVLPSVSKHQEQLSMDSEHCWVYTCLCLARTCPTIAQAGAQPSA
ncbi:TPA: hypothetical protein ACH3X3_008269 [Trebouxia sp. C0006]